MKKILFFLLTFSGFNTQAQFWTEVAPFDPSNNNISPLSMSLVSNQVIWLRVFENNTMKWCRSEDGGINWQIGSFNLGSQNLIVGQIESVSASKAYITAFSTSNSPAIGGVWVTEDGGQNWTKQITAFASSASPFPNFIHFFDENNGVVMGDSQNGNDFEIYITTNGGQNWILVDGNNIPNISSDEYGYTDLYEARGNSLWFGTNKGRIFKSDDRGQHWSAHQSPIENFDNPETGGRFAFKNSLDGLLATRNSNLWETHDGGQTWSILTNGMTTDRCYNEGIVYVPNTNNAYYGYGEIFSTPERSSTYTLDGGNSWANLNNETPNVEVSGALKFLSGTVGYCIGYAIDSPTVTTKLYKLTDPLNRLNGALATTPFEKNIIKLAPNPTKDFISISGSKISTISVTDLTGKTIKSLSYFPSDKIEVDMTSLESGIYVIKISDTSGKVTTEKIIKN